MALEPMPVWSPQSGEQTILPIQLCLLMVSRLVRNANDHITLTSLIDQSGQQKWLHSCCLLGDPKERISPCGLRNGAFTGTRICGQWMWLQFLCPLVGPKGGKQAMWLHHLCLVGVPKDDTNRCGYITPAFTESPNMVSQKCDYITPFLVRSAR